MILFSIIIAAIALSAATASLLICLRKPFSLGRLQQQIGRVLDAEGYNWGKREGQLYAEINGLCFHTRFELQADRGCVRAYFIYHADDQALCGISAMGRLMMNADLNEQHVGTVTLIKGTGIHCMSHADIRTGKDFLSELVRACNGVAGTMSDYEEMKKIALREFPCEEKALPKIGFAA